MPERVNALAGAPSRQGLFAGMQLDSSVDEVLVGIVSEAARATQAPIALVSLILDRIQFFRASQGLPADLASAQATDRDLSICQLVVRDGEVLEVPDTRLHPEVPQGLVESHDVRAYLGLPLRVKGEVLGTLCVIDDHARSFSPAQRLALERLSQRASERLEWLGERGQCSEHALQLEASQVVFGELRNLLLALEGNLSEARFEHVQAAPLARLAKVKNGDASMEALHGAADALEQLGPCLRDAAAAVNRLRPALLALQRVVKLADVPMMLPDAVRGADALAHHRTRLHGGVLWEGASLQACLALREGTLVAALSTLLTRFADHFDRAPQARGPIRVRARRAGADRVVLSLTATDLSPAGAIEIAHQASLFSTMPAGFEMVAAATAVEVALTVANGQG